MQEQDHSLSYNSASGSIKYISTLTQHAKPNLDYEAHSHSREFEIYHFQEGNLFFSFEGKKYPICNGDMVVICNGTLHRTILRSPCRYDRNRILFDTKIFKRLGNMDFDLYNRLRAHKIIILHKEYTETSGICQLFEEIAEYLSDSSSYGEFCALINLFSLLIKAEKEAAKASDTQSFTRNRKAGEIIEYIDSHLAEDLSYRSLSGYFSMSEKNLYKFFKKETGFSLSAYINERRIIKAQALLSTGKTAADAASAAGFQDYSSFYRCFLRVTGITPTEYIKS